MQFRKSYNFPISVDFILFFQVDSHFVGSNIRVNTGGGIQAGTWAQARISMFEAPDWTSEPALGTVSSVPRISRIYANGDRHLDMKLSVTNVLCEALVKKVVCCWDLSHKLTEYSEYWCSFGDLTYNKQINNTAAVIPSHIQFIIVMKEPKTFCFRFILWLSKSWLSKLCRFFHIFSAVVWSVI